MHVVPNSQGLTIDVESEGETERVGHALAARVAPGVVIGLIGPLGAGKTRLVRALAEALGVDSSSIASPTFVLIHEYEGRIPIYHFDTYRLSGPDDFEALGASDYWEAGGVCLVEWADLVSEQLPLDAWTVRIEPTDESRRRLTLTIPGRPDIVRQLIDSLVTSE